jgi:hypothetical protein
VAERKEIFRELIGDIEVSPQERVARFYFEPLPLLEKSIAGSNETGDIHRRDGCGGWI